MPFATELEIDKIEWRTLREQYRKVSLQNGDRTQVHMKDQGNIGFDDIKQRTELEFATSMIIVYCCRIDCGDRIPVATDVGKLRS
ncbi:uncharacterized protein N7529_000233 [Penicillium soppii]|uniref:uncharacterized protein n=1 Tax=Penicillium soppii TaxID=69789 RepID=UPI00254660C0|nr:uncharacterized protein N7529_000233 [Penicillium soppii]KAJ5881561.1 hypothetical protein N7529_000233 [Penicillium soppii]